MKKVIQSTYLYHYRKGHPPTWKWIRQWTERFMLEGLPEIEPGSIEHYKAGKECLTAASKWYSETYTKAEQQEGLINVPITFLLDSGITYLDNIPIITTGKDIELSDFCSPNMKIRDYPAWALYNDMTIHIRSWAFYHATNIKPGKYNRILISDKNVCSVTVSILPHILTGAERTVKYITQGLKKNINYPVFGEQCTGCPNKHYCTI